MAIKKCQVCGEIISSGEICARCEGETLKAGSSRRLATSLVTGAAILAIVLAGLRLSGII
ncbi:MAG: hypothetical protein D6733_01210 [Methanobacteriota archaeon]|nr:MAG: hypothetical protein D6733_01210 [Euryarchaeota archaeon]